MNQAIDCARSSTLFLSLNLPVTKNILAVSGCLIDGARTLFVDSGGKSVGV
jgi:hypothetical protein